MKAANVELCPEADEALDVENESAAEQRIQTEEPSSEMLNPKYWRPNRSDNKVFTAIDRDQENAMVAEYQRTNDEDLYTKLYVMREPTLWVLAKKFAYLSDSEDDLFAELRPVWMKAIRKYNITPSERTLKSRSGQDLLDEHGAPKLVVKSTPFNTLLFTYCTHYLINLYKKKFTTKKRMDANGDPVCNTTRSLDFRYDGDHEGEDEGSSMHELVMDSTSVDIDQRLGAEWVIDQIAGADQQVREALLRYAYDPSYGRLSKACQVITGSLKIRRADLRVFWGGGQVAEDRLEAMIRESKRFDGNFRLLSWRVNLHRVEYEVSVNDWDLYERVLKAIRKVKPKFSPDSEMASKEMALQAFFNTR